MKPELGRKNSRIIIAITMVVLLVGIFVLVYPIAYESACRNRTYPDLESKIDENVMLANIAIVAVSEEQSDNMTSTSYSRAASGVIFLREGGRYYALTANHVTAKEENTNFIIIPYGAPSYKEYRNANENVGLSSYYNQFPNLSGKESANKPGTPLKAGVTNSGNSYTLFDKGIMSGDISIPMRTKSLSYSKDTYFAPSSK